MKKSVIFMSVAVVLSLGCKTGSREESGSQMASDNNQQMTIEGSVTLESLGDDSHSESKRVFITNENDERYQLRKVGENPFELPDSKKLVGMNASCKGSFSGQIFAYSTCESIIEGVVTKEIFGSGSHSESFRVYLTTESGTKYRIQMAGENPFELPDSKALVGSTVRCLGTKNQNLFVYSSCN